MSGLFVTSLDTRRLSYYFADVASGREDCRTHLSADEVSFFGRWSQRRFSSTALEELLDELRGLPRDPRFARPIRNVGYDVCWVAPKQLSILFGTLPPKIAHQILEAHKGAVAESMASIQPMMNWGGDGGVSAVGFVHQSSRSLDPHLHTHVIVANRVEHEDGSFRALDSTGLYRNVKEWSAFYRRSFAREVYQRFGVVMVQRGLDETGGPTEIPGFPPELSRLFSKRSGEVGELVESWGTRAPRATRKASLMTRSEKVTLGSDQLRQRWEKELAEAGYTGRQLGKLFPRNTEHVRSLSVRANIPDQDLAEQSFSRRTHSPARGEGRLTLVSFENDLYQRQNAFSIGQLVAVLANSKEIYRASSNEISLAAFSEPLEIVAFGQLSSARLAALSFDYRHQDLIVACDRPSYEKGDAYRDLPVTPVTELTQDRRRDRSLRPGFDGVKDLETIEPSADALRRAIMSSTKALEGWQLGHTLSSYLILATKRDRDLARAEIAGRLGREVDASGFYDLEPIWIHYLPKGQALASARQGQIDLANQEVRYLLDGKSTSIPLSRLNLSTMISPLSTMSSSDARRAFGAGCDLHLGLGEFVTMERPLNRSELFLGRSSRLRPSGLGFAPRTENGAGEPGSRYRDSRSVVEAGFWREL